VGRWIELGDGGDRAWHASPRTGGAWGVLLVHGCWGLNATFRDMVDRLAEAGFVAIAPDLYRGVVVESVEAARHEAARRPAAERREIVSDALVRLRGEPDIGADAVGVLGFAMGASFALDAAATDPSVAAAVVWYGTGHGPERDWRTSEAAFQGHFAEHDDEVPVGAATELAQSLRQAGRRVEFHVYPGTRRWFMEPDRDAFDERAATLAWERTLAFLRERLE